MDVSNAPNQRRFPRDERGFPGRCNPASPPWYVNARAERLVPQPCSETDGASGVSAERLSSTATIFCRFASREANSDVRVALPVTGTVQSRKCAPDGAPDRKRASYAAAEGEPIDHSHSSAREPQGNGVIERFIRALEEQCLRRPCELWHPDRAL